MHNTTDSLDKSTITLHLGHELIADLIMWQHVNIDDISYLAEYDYLMHKIMFFSLTYYKLDQSIQHQEDGSNKVKLISFKIISSDSLLVANSNHLYLINQKGEIHHDTVNRYYGIHFNTAETTLLEKELHTYFRVMDSNLNVIYEHDFERSVKSTPVFINNVMYIPASDPQKENPIELNKYFINET
ncbi:hypothetical protein LVD15_09465 [Fulvivirga maritima]|uniref:hypothetical protein n=1 Tax=Fulvivirga maritima TaxID=2904247 RepID=UPI001F2BC247|nr:hypothetical protein [Fulvivirga maritima]UII28634.1 hypothetical protein LVD15_09465 [Fulvivirga maritima]